MNKKDAAVYKALTELGMEFKAELPDPNIDRKVDQIINPEDTFLDQVEDLFTKEPTKPA